MMEEKLAHLTVLTEDLHRMVGLIADAQAHANERLARIETRLDVLEKRFDGLETRFDVLEKRFDGLEKRFDGLEERFDVLEKRFDVLEKRFDDFAVETRCRLDRIEGNLRLNGPLPRPKPVKRMPPKFRKKL